MNQQQLDSFNQTRLFFQFINTDKDAFTGKPFRAAKANQIKPKRVLKKQVQQKQDTLKIPAEGGQNMNTKLKKSSLQELGEGQDSESRKLVNKSRAIKRIIQTSRKILQQNFRPDESLAQQKKSHITEFNLYYLQHKRLTEQIITQDQHKCKQQNKFITQLQKNLQNTYQYTVYQDFRQLLDVSLLKDKISKTNIHGIIGTFKSCLVVLKQNQMLVYQGTSQDQPYRCIKLTEIQNVDYFSQPYVFTVMTITKDKSAGSEFLSLKFDSNERQHKWDRAIYCNYISRTMKKKKKYFIYQFPQKQNQKINKQLGQDNNLYDVNIKKSMKSLSGQFNRQKLKSMSRMKTSSRDQNKDNQDQMVDSLMKLSKKKQEPNDINENKSESKYNEKLKNQINIFESKPNNITSSNRIKQKKQQIYSNKQSSSNILDQNQISFNKVQSQIQNNYIEQQKSFVVNNQQVKYKKQLKQKFKDGIILKKYKFFNDKSKIVFLENQQLQYWDIDQKSKFKSNKKVIPFKDLQYQINQKHSSSILFTTPNKSIQFIGNLQYLNNIAQWIELQKKQIPKMQNNKSNEKKSKALQKPLQ